jgi:hypothetical protein
MNCRYELPGLEERALLIKSLGDAIKLRNHLIEQLEEADSECVKDKNALLTFVVVGGGFAGVETVDGINDFVREVLPSYSHLREGMLRVVLVHAGAVVLPELGEKLGVYAQKKLVQRGIEIRHNTRVKGVTARTVDLSEDTAIEGSTVVWEAGTAPNPLLKELRCTKERGRLVVSQFLEVVGWPGVWSLGDCAAVPDASTGQDQPAHRSACATRAKGACPESYSGHPWAIKEALRLFDYRPVRGDWKANRCCVHFRCQLLRLHSLVALAVHLSEQIAEIGKETARGSALELGPAVLEGYCGVSYGLRNHCVSNSA